MLVRTNFSYANLSGVDLYASSIEDANWRGVDLSNALLDAVVFERVDLTDANLTAAWDADVDDCILHNTPPA